jgi:hypothetical protein
MPKFQEGPTAIVALIAFAVWLLVCLPILYLPSGAHDHGEFLGVKYGEWLLFLATMALFWATWQLVKGAEKTSVRQLRAYVFVVRAKIEDVEFAKTPLAKITFLNSGQTPAYNLTATVAIGYGPDNIPSGKFPNEPLAPTMSVMTVGAKQRIRHQITKAIPLSLTEATAIGTGTGAIYVVGSIRYIDAFSKPRGTKFRLVYGANAQKRGDSRLDVCTEGNESD